MSHIADSTPSQRPLQRETSFDWLALLSYVAVGIFALFMYAWEYQHQFTDMWVHANIASEFDFADVHSITSRLAYPMWHISVAIFYQLGLPIAWASALVCALCKVGGMLLAHRMVRVAGGDRLHRNTVTALTFVLMFVVGAMNPAEPYFIYKGIGSPTVWHNPTQLAVIVSMFLCVPYTVKCWEEFIRRLDKDGARAMLHWGKVAALAALLLFSLACKPTMMQALIPAAALFFLVQWIRHPKNWRFFCQMILAYLPAVSYFVLQYLYYTGVVVPFTSGVEFGITPESVAEALLRTVRMSLFPLLALLCCKKQGWWKDQLLVMTLLMVAVAAVEMMLFRETGLREGHGNFTWAGMSASLLLWVQMAGRFALALKEFFAREKKHWAEGSLLVLVAGTFAWHVWSGFYYVYFLLSTNNAF